MCRQQVHIPLFKIQNSATSYLVLCYLLDISLNTVNLHSSTSEYYQKDSALSFETLINNTSLLTQMNRLLQDQFVAQSSTVIQLNEFLPSYREKIEFHNGSYYAPLPWKPYHPPLTSNLKLCKQRLEQVTSRFTKLGLMDAYHKVMAEHLSNGYIAEVQGLKHPWPEEGCHYLPHFFVLKDSETAPLRIVLLLTLGKVVSMTAFRLAPIC